MSLSTLRDLNISMPEPSYKDECAKAFRNKDYYKVQSLLPLVKGHNDVKCYSDSHHYMYYVHLAAINGWADITKLLVTKYDCNPKQKDSCGLSAFHQALLHGHLDIVKYFVSSDLCDDTEEHSRKTPLHMACLHGHFSVVQYLVGEGFSIDATDQCGFTSLHWAVQNGHLQIVQYLAGDCHGATNIRDINGYTILHTAAYYGHLPIVQYLVSEGHCSIDDRTNIGEMPLHMAAQCGHLSVVMYFVELGSDVMATDNQGNTPLHSACHWNLSNRNIPVIKYLLSMPIFLESFTENSRFSSPTLQAIDGATAVYEKFKQIKISHPVGSIVNIMLLGSSGAGKTTLFHAIKGRPKTVAQSVRNFFVKAKVKKVQLCTAGVIPNKLHDESLGDVIIYDFSGQPEYLSSHAGVLESMLESSGAIVVLIVNLAEDLTQQIRCWSNIVINECMKASSECHIVVIGSHADEVKEQLQQKMLQVEDQIREQLAGADYSIASIFPLDCRLCSSDNLQSFLESLSHLCESVRSRQSLRASLYCNFLLSILEAKVSVCTLETLLSLCDQSQASQPHCFAAASQDLFDDTILRMPLQNFVAMHEAVPLPDDIVPLLNCLHSAGLIVYLENKEDLKKSWIIVNKESLLAEVIGTLFAPFHYAEHQNIASSTGIVTSHVLEQLFPQFSSDVLIAFLKSLKLCVELDEALTKITNFEIKEGDSSCSKLLFFPALIAITRPDIKREFMIGWCLKALEYVFSIRFLHVLLLHLISQYSQSVGASSGSPLLPPGLEWQCSVWLNGIHWYNNKGIEVLVEQGEDNRCVVMLMSCQEGAEVDMIKLHCELIQTITRLQRKYCPILHCKEYLLAPQLLQYPFIMALKVTCYDIEELRSCIDQDRNSILCVDGDKKACAVNITEILPINPKEYLYIYENTSISLSSDDQEMKQDDSPRGNADELTTTTATSNGKYHLMGIMESPPEAAGLGTSVGMPMDKILDISDLGDIQESANIIVDWKRLGLELGMCNGTLEKIEEEQSGDIDRCKQDMLAVWLRQNKESTWSTFVNAVDKIDKALSENIRQQCVFDKN